MIYSVILTIQNTIQPEKLAREGEEVNCGMRRVRQEHDSESMAALERSDKPQLSNHRVKRTYKWKVKPVDGNSIHYPAEQNGS